jgi:CHASE2 domain-containing sensor protein
VSASGVAHAAETALQAPYVGLNYYTEADAHIFFGRDAERRKIIGNLRTARLTLLYAGSGVGKSSLLRAGVAARLRALARDRAAGDPARYVPVVFSAWKDDPVQALQAEVDAAVQSLPAGASEAVASQPLELALERAATRVDATLLIILDQFEEYFLYHAGQSAFAEELARCINRPDLRVRFLIAIRDDAYAMLGNLFKGRIPNVYGNYLHLGYLGRDAAREAIRKPLERYNELREGAPPVAIEAELVEAVLDQVRAGQVALEAPGLGGRGDFSPAGNEVETPYLQLVMKRLWDSEMSAGSHKLRLTTLIRLGGAEAIVKTHLDTALSHLPERRRDVAVDVFHHLITPSRTKIAHDIPSLAEYTGHTEAEVGRLLEALSSGDTRIVRPIPPPPGRDGSARYEVFHDVLAAPILDWRARQMAERLERERHRLEVRSARLLSGLVSVIAVVVALMVYIVNPGPLQRLDLSTIDARFAVSDNSPPSDIVLVGIDTPTLNTFADRTGRIPRTVEARAIDQILRGRPAVIAEDILYDDARAGDAQLFSAIRRARGHIVLAAVTLNGSGDTTLFGHDPAVGEGGKAFVRGLGAAPGYVGITPDRDRQLRHFQSSVGLTGAGSSRMLTLPVVTARLAGRAVPDFGNAWIDYRGIAGTIPRVSFLDVVRGHVPPGRFRGKIVVVGATIAGVDQHPTPAGGGSMMPGAEILANATWTAVHGLPLHESRGADFAVIVLLGLVPLCVLLVRPVLALLACLLAAGLFLVEVQVAFELGLIMSVVYPLLALVLSIIGQVVLRMVTHKRVTR